MRFSNAVKNRIRAHLEAAPKPTNIDCPEIPFEEDVSNGCQGCGGSYDNNHIVIVEDLGPVCPNCLHNLAHLCLT